MLSVLINVKRVSSLINVSAPPHPSSYALAYWSARSQLHSPATSLCVNKYIACLHDQRKSGFFGGPAFFQPIRAF